MAKRGVGSGVSLKLEPDTEVVEERLPRYRAMMGRIAEREIWYRTYFPDVPEKDRYIVLSIRVQRVWCTSLGVNVPVLGMGYVASLPDSRGYMKLRFRLRTLKESLQVLVGETPMNTVNPRSVPLLGCTTVVKGVS